MNTDSHTILENTIDAPTGKGTTLVMPTKRYGDEALTVEAWVEAPAGRTDTHQVLVADWRLRRDLTAFESYDAGATDGMNTKGFFGSVCDGRTSGRRSEMRRS